MEQKTKIDSLMQVFREIGHKISTLEQEYNDWDTKTKHRSLHERVIHKTIIRAKIDELKAGQDRLLDRCEFIRTGKVPFSPQLVKVTVNQLNEPEFD